MHAEMYGKSAIGFKVVVEQHVITTETLQGFEPIVNGLLNQSYDFSKIFRAANFKSVLKEFNAKSNGIFN